MTLLYILFILLLVLFFIFLGYKEDYKRNPTDFKETIIPLLGAVLIIVLVITLKLSLDTYIEKELKSYYIDKLGANSELNKLDLAKIDIQKFNTESNQLKNKIYWTMFAIDWIYLQIGWFLFQKFKRLMNKN